MSIGGLTALSDAHAATLSRLVAALVEQLLGAWAGFDAWHQPDLVAGRAAASAQFVTAAVPVAARASRAYATATMRDLGVTPRRLPAVDTAYPRANATPFEVYQRPATQYAYSGSRGLTAYEAAVDARARLAVLAESDLRAADRAEAQRTYAATPQVTGYRRIIHPELSKSGHGTCGLCVVASQRVYRTSELLPMHFPSCHCDTAPIVGDEDPGHQLNEADLATLYAAAGGTAADQLRETRVRFAKHGELGPVLVREGDHFTDARDLDLKPWRKSDKATVRAARARELEQVEAAYTAARAAADAYDREYPAGNAARDQQRAYQLQRAWLDLAARQRSLRTPT